MDTINDDWIDQVQAELDRRGMSRSDLARLISASPSQITNVLNGHDTAGRQMIERIASALEFEVKFVLIRKTAEAAS